METIVRNVKTGVHSNGVYIGRPSILGNPFKIGPDGTRDQVIDKYAIYFYNRLEMDDDFYVKVEELRGKTLLCFCFPKKCHGDVIAQYLNEGYDVHF